MEKEKTVSPKIKLYTAIILLLLYIAVTSLPFTLWINDVAGKIIDITLKIGFIVFAYFSIDRYQLCKIKYLPDKNWKLLLFIPLVVLTFSNWIFVWIFNSPLNNSINGGIFTLTLFATLVTVFCEELLFREIIHEALREYIKKDYLLILLSAGIFATAHFINFFGGMDILAVLAQVGYTFVLGLILGLLKEKKAGFVALVVFHLLFNVFNNDLFSLMYQGGWNFEFVFINVAIGLVVVIYGIGMYFLLNDQPLPFSPKNNKNDKVSNSSKEQNN